MNRTYLTSASKGGVMDNWFYNNIDTAYMLLMYAMIVVVGMAALAAITAKIREWMNVNKDKS